MMKTDTLEEDWVRYRVAENDDVTADTTDDQLEKVLSTLAARKRATLDDLFEMTSHQIDPFRTEFVRYRNWIGCRHTPLTSA